MKLLLCLITVSYRMQVVCREVTRIVFTRKRDCLLFRVFTANQMLEFSSVLLIMCVTVVKGS